MLLRSSSTPVLGTLCSSFSDATHHETTAATARASSGGKNPPIPIDHHSHTRLLFRQPGSLNLMSFTRNSASDLPNSDHHCHVGNFRRAQSDGNLEALAAASCSNHGKSPDCRPSCPMLQTIPSFSFQDSREEDSDSETVGEDEFNMLKNKMNLLEEMEFMNPSRSWNLYQKGEDQSGSQVQMYLAKGLGVAGGEGGYGCGGSGGGGGDFTSRNFGSGGGDGPEFEEYYKKMVEENPGNPLFLSNYAHFLYHSKKDLQRAEEYYSRAILADPSDGESLSQYARLTWEVHHDQHRTSSYFERAVRASPEDSHVHAAYASFLWDVGGKDEDGNVAANDPDAVWPFPHRETMASASA